MIDSLIGVLFGVPLMTALSATGRIRNYQITVSCIILCILPVGYVALRLGYGATSVFYISILFTILSGFTRFLFCRKQIGFSLRKNCEDVLLPVLGVTITSLPVPLFLKISYLEEQSLLNFVCLSIITLFITMVSAWCVGLKRNERTVIVSLIKYKLGKV